MRTRGRRRIAGERRCAHEDTVTFETWGGIKLNWLCARCGKALPMRTKETA